jgi:hypothetical protein
VTRPRPSNRAAAAAADDHDGDRRIGYPRLREAALFEAGRRLRAALS